MIQRDSTTANSVGSGEFVYEPDDAWHRLPDGMALGEAVGVATDSQDRLYVFNRGGQQPVMVFDSDGDFLHSRGAGNNPYSVGDFIAPHDIWLNSRGDVFVGEVTISAAAKRGLVGEDCPSLQKFTKQ